METVLIAHDKRNNCDQQEPCVAALGFFDGVHIGHQTVIEKAKTIAERKKVKLAVMTFFPHPKEVLSGGKNPVQYLTPLSLKKEKFEQLGVDILYVVRFDLMFAALSPQQFVNDYLLALNVKHVVAGFDFTYGCRGEGNMKTIKDHGIGQFGVTTVSKVNEANEKISSTLIREMLGAGDVDNIPNYLGTFYETRGKIRSIHSKGRTEDQSKAIVKIDPHFTLPKPGVYETEAIVNDQRYKSVSYIRANHKYTGEIEVEILKTLKQHKEIQLKWIRRLHEDQGQVYMEEIIPAFSRVSVI
ncbi:riboflavin kinase [Bacillus songklensis]|uniref:Riboflavin biosynthesis protein n=1 Tax=Bacillus songklensis TaxID=1069116 RepID=A0ABV8B1C5_9BACI